MRRMRAKYRGRCRSCGESIAVGESILWGRREGAHHARCPEESAASAAEEAEYRAGYAEAGRYLSDREIYGAEMAERFEMERELAAFNRGEDY